MKIKELEEKAIKKGIKEDFRWFYRYIKRHNYNLSVRDIKNMYRIYVR